MADETSSGSDSNNSGLDSDNLGADTPVAKNKGNDSQSDKETMTKQTTATHEKSSPAELFNAKPMPKMLSKKSHNNWLIPSVIALLVIIGLIVSGWTAYQQYLFNQNWAEHQTKIDTQINRQDQLVEQAKNTGQTSLQAANQNQIQLNQLTANNQQISDSLYSTQEKIKALSGRQKQDWMLAEAAYLIKVAQLQLILQKDKATAIQLLKTADSRIIEIADNSLFPIREAIAKDLSELSLILDADITGIALALNAINQQIPQLELVALQFAPLEESLESVVVEEQGFDLDKIYQGFLKDFVVIKDHSEPVKPLMTSDQRLNLNTNIQLAIQQAQIALVQGNASLYRLNIDNAVQWTDEFFKHDNKALQVIEQLNSLKTKPIEVNYPNKLNAQKALDAISQQQLYHWLESSLTTPTIKNNLDSVKELKLKENKTDLQIEPKIEPFDNIDHLNDQNDDLNDRETPVQEAKP